MSGKVGKLSQNITQSYQPNSHMWLMLAVLPVIMVSGTSPLVIYTELLVKEQINASSLIQWAQSTLGELVLIILPDTPRFSSRIQLSAACCHGEYGSVCLAWQSASRSFLLKSPLHCLFKLSNTMVRGTPSRWNNRDKAS